MGPETKGFTACIEPEEGTTSRSELWSHEGRGCPTNACGIRQLLGTQSFRLLCLPSCWSSLVPCCCNLCSDLSPEYRRVSGGLASRQRAAGVRSQLRGFGVLGRGQTFREELWLLLSTSPPLSAFTSLLELSGGPAGSMRRAQALLWEVDMKAGCLGCSPYCVFKGAHVCSTLCWD